MSSSNSDCLFCKFVSGEIEPKKIKETDNLLAFHDISPQAKTHILIIPKQHVASVNQLESHHAEVVGQMMLMAKDIMVAAQGSEDGYRLVINTGPKAGQTVFHLHMHLLAGRQFSWPPG